MAIDEKATGNDSVAITGTASAGARTVGVKGIGDSVGVQGQGKTWHGVEGISDSNTGGFGVFGTNTAGGTGVVGESTGGMGVYGKSDSTTGGAGVMGEAVGSGVIGKSKTWMGVYGESESTTGGAGVMGEHKANGAGIVGKSTAGVGVWGTSETHEGVHAETKSTVTAAMAAFQTNADSGSAAFFAKHMGNRTAGRFEGDVEVTGVIHMTRADYAEDFTVANPEDVEPGMVMILDEIGGVRVSQEAYDRRVAGVVSGAGSYKPAVILDHDDAIPNRLPLALMGKVYCMVDATDAPVGIGDLLTTSSVPGHAMKAADPLRAFGSVIGKALRPLAGGRGLIPILVRFQ